MHTEEKKRDQAIRILHTFSGVFLFCRVALQHREVRRVACHLEECISTAVAYCFETTNLDFVGATCA